MYHIKATDVKYRPGKVLGKYKLVNNISIVISVHNPTLVRMEHSLSRTVCIYNPTKVRMEHS